MEKRNYAVIKEENGSAKVITLDGNDITKLIKPSVLQRAVEDGEKVMYLNESGVWARGKYLSSSMYEEVLSSSIELVKPVTKATETNPVFGLIKTGLENKPSELFCNDLKWKYLVRSAVRGKNVMLTGDAGTGKTFTARMVAKGLKREYFYFNLGGTQDPRATLIGTTQFKPDEGTLFNQSPFVKAIQVPNATILLDEITRANPEAWNILMPVLDEGQRYLRLDEAENSPTIKVAEGVQFIATANIGSEYTATRVIDRALMDRFTIIEVEALDRNGEKNLIKHEYPELDTAFVEAIADIAVMSREQMKTEDPKISTPISTRSTLELAGLIYDGFTLTEASEVAVMPFYDADGGVDSERTYVKQLVQKYSHLDNPTVNDDGDVYVDDEELFNITD